MTNNSGNRAKYSLIIPCYNEEGNIANLVERANLLITADNRVECIFVNNGSTDNTPQLLNVLTNGSSRLRLVNVPVNQGYGYGIKQGLAEAEGDVIGWTHADLQTDPLDVLRVVAEIDSDYSRVFVKGRRLNRPLSDRFFTAGMSIFESVLFQINLRDINAQPTMFSRELLREVDLGPNDFSLDLFAMVVSRKNSYRQIRIPVEFGPRHSGTSKWNTSILDRLRFIRRTLIYSLALARELRVK